MMENQHTSAELYRRKRTLSKLFRRIRRQERTKSRRAVRRTLQRIDQVQQRLREIQLEKRGML